MIHTQQLALDLGVGHNLRNFDTFIIGNNAEAVCMLKNLIYKPLNLSPSRMLYIWGETESGKTHILQSLHALAKYKNLYSTFLSPKNSLSEFEFLNDTGVYCIDDIQLMSNEQQIAVFNLVNEIRNAPLSCIITSGNCAPKDLNLREDVRTRMGWGLIYQIHSLNLLDKKKAIINNAKARGILLDIEIVNWLLEHTYSDMNSLIDVLNALDMYSLQHKKPVSLLMLKRMLQEWAT